MVIVLIWWRIKPTAEAARELRDWWQDHAYIENDDGLFRESLSAPIPAQDLPFASDDLHDPEGGYQVFVNVGVWRDRDDFREQVAKYFDDDGPLQPFEHERRRRTLLVP